MISSTVPTGNPTLFVVEIIVFEGGEVNRTTFE
jgi:hypothetical protein